MTTQRNKVHTVTVISAVAQELGVEELKNLLEPYRRDPKRFR